MKAKKSLGQHFLNDELVAKKKRKYRLSGNWTGQRCFDQIFAKKKQLQFKSIRNRLRSN